MIDTEIDKFLSSKIKCLSCGEGAISFSLTYDSNNNLISKYGEFCSIGCNLDFYNYSDLEIKNREKSRCNTPTS